MISLKEKVQAALADVCGRVIYGYPRGFAGAEMICWRESENRRHAQADAKEYLAEVNYTLEAAGDLLASADARMQAAGFRREAAVEQFEQDLTISHVCARYRALADDKGNIYQ